MEERKNNDEKYFVNSMCDNMLEGDEKVEYTEARIDQGEIYG